MGSVNFKQWDRRWAYTPYAARTMLVSGCGPTAVADIVYAKDASMTPRKMADWMSRNGYASNGSGTYWSGIKAALQAHGFPTIWHDTVSQMFDELAKGDRWGILLFKSGSKGGVTWTSGGHFVCVRDYKYENGQHWLYIGDPGGRNHDGWYSYEQHMAGLIIHCWTCYLPGWTPGSAPSNVVPAAPSSNSSGTSGVMGAAVNEPVCYVSSKNGLNVRTGPGTNYPAIKTLSYGTPIKPVRRAGNWVYSNGAGGWLCSDFLSSKSSNVSAPSSSRYPLGKYAVSVVGGLNVRTGPGTNYSRVQTLKNGTPLLILKVSGSWGYSKGAGGWICLDYCKRR